MACCDRMFVKGPQREQPIARRRGRQRKRRQKITWPNQQKMSHLLRTKLHFFLLLTTGLVLQSRAFVSKQSLFGLNNKRGTAFRSDSSSRQFLYASDFQTNEFSGAGRKPTNASHSSVASPLTQKSSRIKEDETPQFSSARPPTKEKYNLTLVLIDHYDSFTYNLYDMLAQLCVNPPIVLAKDSFDDWSEVIESYGNNIDGVILSPGPGTPTNPDDIGSLSPSIIEQNPDLPILGVCLGHQIMGHFYGAQVDLCGPVHGQVRTIEQEAPPAEKCKDTISDPLWDCIPEQFDVTRYHSLAVTLPGNGKATPLRPTAYTKEDDPNDRILMAMSHTENPHYGVQFHPESIGSQQGLLLLMNFCNVCQDSKSKQKGDMMNLQPTMSEPKLNGHDRETNMAVNGESSNAINQASRTDGDVMKTAVDPPRTAAKIFVHKVPNTRASPVEVFDEFLAAEAYSVWLDTSVGVQSATNTEGATYSSILGAGQAPIEYYGKECPKETQGLFRYDRDGESKTLISDDDILTFLQKEHAKSTDSVTMVSFGAHGANDYSTTDYTDDGSLLPFDFRGGHVGYLGYEVRHDSQRFLEEQEQGMHSNSVPYSFQSTSSSTSNPPSRNGLDESVPTAAFLFLDKSFVFDHSSKEWFLVSVIKDENNLAETADAVEWIQSTADKVKRLGRNSLISKESDVLRRSHSTKGNANGKLNGSAENGKGAGASSVSFTPNRSRVVYNQNFADCQEQIRLGESYELCLTNHLEADVAVSHGSSPLGLYKILRDRNPAPFSAFLNWNTKRNAASQSRESSSLALCCSSPERFVSVKRKQVTTGINGNRETTTKLEVEAKPIKGTCARVLPKVTGGVLSEAEHSEDARRALELKESVKNRAENLMIVDLLRNDLSRVCEIGSVHVSSLMDIESYATVHQMVSTIRGTLDPLHANAVDILKATFPGGSMTGAPKIRTMEIIDQLEEGVRRGPYSGCLGYISMNGSMDMNIVIRTAVLKPSKISEKDAPALQDHWKVSIGAGGAITALSESTDEYEEMRLKAAAVIRAVKEWVASTNVEAQEPVVLRAKASPMTLGVNRTNAIL